MTMRTETPVSEQLASGVGERMRKPLRTGDWLWLSIAVLAALVPAHGQTQSSRVPWTTSRIDGTPEPPAPYVVERLFPQIRFETPVDFALEPGTGRWFILQLNGSILVLDPASPDEALMVLDAPAGGLEVHQAFSIAFHPHYLTNRELFLCYINQPEGEDGTRVVRLRVPAEPGELIDTTAEEILLTWPSGGHNGGCLRFGPDQKLYISTGDGAAPFPPDEFNAGQSLTDLRASILRIDIDQADEGRPYAIPPDNPFIQHEGSRGEIWALGLRNPWRMNFDPQTGTLWAGDVGWERWESLQRIVRGGNFGWPLREGSHPVRSDLVAGPGELLSPVVEYPHTEGRSITGGVVYHGRNLPQLTGSYLYGDWATGKIWQLRVDHASQQVVEPEELVDTVLNIIAFGVDADGELVIVDYGGGLYRMVPNADKTPNNAFPRRLSETGLFDDTKLQTPAAGVIPYEVNAELFSEGAISRRFLAIPGNGQVYLPYYAYPRDTVAVKTLAIPLDRHGKKLRNVETQLLHFDGSEWRGYSYLWNDEQTDAVLVPREGIETQIRLADDDTEDASLPRVRNWRIVNRAECLTCHVWPLGFIAGFKVPNLNRDVPADPHLPGTQAENQLDRFERWGLFDSKISIADRAVAMVNPYDASADLSLRARSYLSINCSHCHRREGGGNARIEFPFEFSIEQMHAVNELPTQGNFDLTEARIIQPGRPEQSVLYYRLATVGRGHMPYTGSRNVDDAGLSLIREWIISLERDPEEVQAEEKMLLVELDEEAIPPVTGETSAALRLADQLARVSNTERRQRIAARISRESPEHVKGLFERFLPVEQRRQTLGMVVNPEEIFRLKGNVAAGRFLFQKAEGFSCRNCHRSEGIGRELGPDLSKIGSKRSREQILKSILEPSAEIDQDYVMYLLETTDGRVLTGLVTERTEERIRFKDVSGAEQELSMETIEELVPQPRSLMPDLLHRDMTPQELADLLAYLSSLR
ncbi:MAG TPA: PQQ-dependent sugar dehydrogenase [Planctomicrobium sp.]|nr:PQQ-dependent sugar dehydrogenase [Planctomicrobium sp.]